jgi:hypothetical protein
MGPRVSPCSGEGDDLDRVRRAGDVPWLGLGVQLGADVGAGEKVGQLQPSANVLAHVLDARSAVESDGSDVVDRGYAVQLVGTGARLDDHSCHSLGMLQARQHRGEQPGPGCVLVGCRPLFV